MMVKQQTIEATRRRAAKTIPMIGPVWFVDGLLAPVGPAVLVENVGESCRLSVRVIDVTTPPTVIAVTWVMEEPKIVLSTMEVGVISKFADVAGAEASGRFERGGDAAGGVTRRSVVVGCKCAVLVGLETVVGLDEIVLTTVNTLPVPSV
jgi:hypothetical protein